MEIARRHYMRLHGHILRNLKSTTLLFSSVGMAAYLISLMGILPENYRAETERCMQDLGCFSIDGDYVLRPFNVLPQHRAQVGTKFLLYNTGHVPAEYLPDEADLLVSHLDSSKGLIVFVHGWISSQQDVVIAPLIDALVETKASLMNILLVEWKIGAAQPYPQSVANTRVVGAELARLLNKSQNKIGLDRVHLIGASLGAHISGTCGSLLPGIGRITALDAAGPLFEHYPECMRLDASDALFVDAIHTDGDDFYGVVMAEGGLGIHHGIGHADFYPNGGHSQPHCLGVMSRTLAHLTSGELSLTQLKKIVACDHELSLDYFTQSLQTPHSYVAYVCHDDMQGFVDGRCYGNNNMGYDAVRPEVNSKYYLYMSNNHPYLGNHYMVNLTIHSVGLVCLNLTLVGDDGRASQVQQQGVSKSCTNSSTQSAMLFASGEVGSLHTLTVTWVDSPRSHNQVLVHGLTQLTIHNATVSHINNRWFTCEAALLRFTKSVSLSLSTSPCSP